MLELDLLEDEPVDCRGFLIDDAVLAVIHALDRQRIAVRDIPLIILFLDLVSQRYDGSDDLISGNPPGEIGKIPPELDRLAAYRRKLILVVQIGSDAAIRADNMRHGEISSERIHQRAVQCIPAG